MHRLAAPLLLASVWTAGCTSTSTGYTQADYDREIDEARRDLRAAIGQARASDVSMCRVLELGDRPCGGPAYFLPYSVTDADTALVNQLAARIGEIDRRANRELGLASTCELRVAPPAELIGGRCVFARAE